MEILKQILVVAIIGLPLAVIFISLKLVLGYVYDLVESKLRGK